MKVLLSVLSVVLSDGEGIIVCVVSRTVRLRRHYCLPCLQSYCQTVKVTDRQGVVTNYTKSCGSTSTCQSYTSPACKMTSDESYTCNNCSAQAAGCFCAPGQCRVVDLSEYGKQTKRTAACLLAFCILISSFHKLLKIFKFFSQDFSRMRDHKCY